TAQWDNTINPGSPHQGGNNATALGAECLIHAAGDGPGRGQDLINNPGIWPVAATQIKSQSGPKSGNLVTTSNSIITIPIIAIDPPFSSSMPTVTIVGYLQAFINQVDPVAAGPPPGSINITVLNIAGCGPNNGAPPVVGTTATSPVPVRLITAP